MCFNTTGNRLVTASADCTARVYNVMTGACISILIGHEGEISKAGLFFYPLLSSFFLYLTIK